MRAKTINTPEKPRRSPKDWTPEERDASFDAWWDVAADSPGEFDPIRDFHQRLNGVRAKLECLAKSDKYNARAEANYGLEICRGIEDRLKMAVPPPPERLGVLCAQLAEQVRLAELHHVDADNLVRLGRNYRLFPKEALALAFLAICPEWTDRQIAEAVGCSTRTLYRSEKFKKSRKIQQEVSIGRVRRGSKFEGKVETPFQRDDDADDDL